MNLRLGSEGQTLRRSSLNSSVFSAPLRPLCELCVEICIFIPSADSRAQSSPMPLAAQLSSRCPRSSRYFSGKPCSVLAKENFHKPTSRRHMLPAPPQTRANAPPLPRQFLSL